MRQAAIISVLRIQHRDPEWGKNHFLQFAQDGAFELRGLDPARPQTVCFLDSEHFWGTTLEVNAGQQKNQELLVKLQPCGSARMRFVDANGQPVPDAPQAPPVGFRFKLAAGRRTGSGPAAIEPGSAYLPSIDPIHYGATLQVGPDGWLTLPGLIPGATYFLNSSPEYHQSERKEFQVEAGQTVGLGDVRVQGLGF